MVEFYMTKPLNGKGSTWFERGDEDYSSAVLICKHDGPSSVACFHAQQTAEKYLKGFLATHNIVPRKIHNLEELAKECAKIDPDFLDYLDECLFLSRYYLETRYPMSIPVHYELREVENSISSAEKIVNFVKKKVCNK